MNEENILKIAIISGASHALNHRSRNPRLSDDEVLKHIAEEADEIAKKIGQEE